MHEATGDKQYLELRLAWAETMVSRATVIDRFGKRNWPGPWKWPHSQEPVCYTLCEQQGSTELARLARIILTTPTLRAAYGKRARAIVEFVKRDVIDKQLDDDEGFPWHLNQVRWTGHPMSDKTGLMLRLLVDVYLVDRETKYLECAGTLAIGFKKRFQPYRGAKIWDLDIGEPNHPPDTSHANRFSLAVIDLCQAGIVFQREDIQSLADLFTTVIWNQSLSDPMFTNYIDGSNGPFRNRGPWNNGLIYCGWAAARTIPRHRRFATLPCGQSSPANTTLPWPTTDRCGASLPSLESWPRTSP